MLTGSIHEVSYDSDKAARHQVPRYVCSTCTSVYDWTGRKQKGLAGIVACRAIDDKRIVFAGQKQEIAQTW